MTTDGDKVKPNLKSDPPQCSKKGEFNPNRKNGFLALCFSATRMGLPYTEQIWEELIW